MTEVGHAIAELGNAVENTLTNMFVGIEESERIERSEANGEIASENLMLSAYSLWGVGGPLLLTGLILIIYDAVKFAPCRKANADAQAIRWSPDLIVTPDYQGMGVNIRF